MVIELTTKEVTQIIQNYLEKLGYTIGNVYTIEDEFGNDRVCIETPFQEMTDRLPWSWHCSVCMKREGE